MSIFKITSVFEIAKRGNQVNPFTIQEAELELAALREAGEKMAKRLRALRAFDDEWNMRDTPRNFFVDAAVLAEWEAANK